MKDEDDILKGLMSNDGSNYIMDGGFTKRVLGSLPKAHALRTSARRRSVMILFAAVAGCAVSGFLSAPALMGIVNSLNKTATDITPATDSVSVVIYAVGALAAASLLALLCLRASEN